MKTETERTKAIDEMMKVEYGKYGRTQASFKTFTIKAYCKDCGSNNCQTYKLEDSK